MRSTDGTALAVDVRGPAGAPAIVLVTGVGLARSSWGELPSRMAERHRVIAYDLRGHGHSGRARSGDYGLGAHAADLAAVLDAELAPGERAVAVGHSYGGAVVLAHAAEADDHRLAGVVFAGSSAAAITVPALPRPRGGWDTRPLRAAWLGAMRLLARLMAAGRRLTPLADATTRRVAFSDDAPADDVRRARRMFLLHRPDVLAESARAGGAVDARRWGGALDVPALVLWGTEDPQIDEQDRDGLLEALPDGELVEVPGAGHMLPLTHPGVVAEHTARLARRVLSDRAPAPAGGRPSP